MLNFLRALEVDDVGIRCQIRWGWHFRCRSSINTSSEFTGLDWVKIHVLGYLCGGIFAGLALLDELLNLCFCFQK
ncbi:hypothetical protein D3C86_2062830 [compost metagenome]